MLAAGFIAAACVDWYNIPSREGASGYYVIGIALLGLIAGCVIGLIVARLVAAGADPRFLKAIGRSVAVVAVISIVSGAAARLLADVPPTIDGEALMLAVEVRWPEDQVERPATGEGSLSLHSIPFYSNTVRASEEGPLWMQDAERVDGRWIARGAVSVFTSRGKRMLVVAPNRDDRDARTSEAFLVPLPAWPGKGSLEWSEWLPKIRPGVAPLNKLTYRYRVQRSSEAVRTEHIGDWAVGTATSGFYSQTVNGRPTHAATAVFTLKHAGQDVLLGATNEGSPRRIDDIALLARPGTAFIVHVDRDDTNPRSYLVSADSGVIRPVEIGESYTGVRAEQLTADTARFRAIRHREIANGQVNRTTYDQPGLYLMGNAVVDTRSLVVHHFTPDTSASGIPSIPPLSVSPDERSFVQFANAGYPSEAHLLVVTNFVDNTTYILPVDEARMRYPDFDALDPAWIAHHFEWKHGAGVADRLVERAGFTPLPYYGTLSTETGGERSYRIEKASDSLRTALVAFLVARFKAEPLPADSDAYEYPVKIGDQMLDVAHSSGFGYVLVSMKDRGGDTTLVPEIAQQFNAVLATGRYDSMFGSEP